MTPVRIVLLACALPTLALVPPAAASVPPSPTVSRVSANVGPVSGGQRVTISGAHFVSVRAVRFGAVAGRSLHVVGSRKLTAIAPSHALGVVHVQVITATGTSAKTAADEFSYLPDPVSALTVADTTGTSVLLAWQPPAGADGIVVRRAEGASPPTARSGSKVATLAGDATGLRDTGLVLNTKYAYAVFAKVGAASSQATTTTTHSAKADRPAAPAQLVVGAAASAGAERCTGVPAWLGNVGGASFPIGATIADPDAPGTPIRGEFELRDLTDPSSPVDVVIAADQSGWTTMSTASPAFVSQRFAPTTLVDGHTYSVDALTSDGSTASRPSAACTFAYDAQAPSQPKVTMKESSVHVGDTVHFTFSASDIEPASGSVSEIDHFSYSTSSESQLAGDGGSHVAAVGDGLKRSAQITLSPTAWGTNYLYVQAVDAAGNESTVRSFQYYVSG